MFTVLWAFVLVYSVYFRNPDTELNATGIPDECEVFIIVMISQWPISQNKISKTKKNLAQQISFLI